MSMTLTKPKQRKKSPLSDTPNYITILPPGRLIAEKMFDLGLDASELAKRMKVPIVTIEKLLRFEIPLTERLAKKLERATWMPTHVMLRYETRWREDMAYAMEHPEIPAFLNGEIINQPKQTKKKKA
jgi:plasmid maintenance system antidote protein VapI